MAIKRRHLADNSNHHFICIFVTKNICILIQISVRYIHMVSVYNQIGLLLLIVRHRTGNKPLSESMMHESTQ